MSPHLPAVSWLLRDVKCTLKGQVSPNSYVTNNQSVLRYLKVAEECATAKVMRLGN